MKTCKTCKREFNLSGFPTKKDKRHSQGFYYLAHCKECYECKKQIWNEKYNSTNNKVSNVAYSFEYRKNAYYKSRFGITLECYRNMLKAQNEVCAICGKVNGCGKALAVDHDHETGKVRALLCANCNVGIGLLKDDPNVLKKAYEYLFAHKM
ncbi:endonuclease VII domain-containing protein [Escherichia coli]